MSNSSLVADVDRPASSHRLPAVLFDLDGTLIDSIELILQSMRFAFTACGATAPADAEWLTGVGIPLGTMFRRYCASDDELARLIAQYRVHQTAHHDRLVVAYDAVVDTVALLRTRGHPLAVVTSKTESLARRGLAHVGLLPLFDSVIGCDSCERHKPDPAPVRLALDRVHRSPAEAFFVGDSIHDIAAGNAAGVTTVAALWGPFTRAELEGARPAFFLEAIADLPALIDGSSRLRAS